MSTDFKTWVEINKKAAKHNLRTFRDFLGPKTKLWSVVKSNAYGHGLSAFSTIVGQEGGVDGFCVDSVAEGLKLRQNGIKKPILVLGPTLFPSLFKAAENEDITITVSNFDTLNKLKKIKNPPKFHLKIDTGMHRQGFYLKDLPKVIKLLRTTNYGLRTKLTGAYTHFASAKDINYPTYTNSQFHCFTEAAAKLKKSGFKNIDFHTSATGGTLIDSRYHLSAVRIGIGLYGLWPSKELYMQRGKDLELKPVLSWHTVISEVKNLQAGDFVGYDLVERIPKKTRLGILPVGYWHGFPRSLSGIGEVLVNGCRARVLGRVSMDLVAVNLGKIPCKVGDKATIVGRQPARSGKDEEISAFDVAQKIGTIHYELTTNINPLIKRVVV